MRSPCVSTLRRRVVLLVVALLAVGVARAQVPSRNVNMVSGTEWPGGDPFLQRQNEPSVAVSTRNPMHLLAGANDYRTVDLPGLPDDKMTGDAWLGVFMSSDGGATWKSTLVPGYPQEVNSTSPLHGFDAGADPVVRAGPHGLFYYSGIVFDRDNPVLEARGRAAGHTATAGVGTSTSAVFVARYIDNNVKENGNPIAYLGTTIVANNDNPNVVPRQALARRGHAAARGGHVHDHADARRKDGHSDPPRRQRLSWPTASSPGRSRTGRRSGSSCSAARRTAVRPGARRSRSAGRTTSIRARRSPSTRGRARCTSCGAGSPGPSSRTRRRSATRS